MIFGLWGIVRRRKQITVQGFKNTGNKKIYDKLQKNYFQNPKKVAKYFDKLYKQSPNSLFIPFNLTFSFLLTTFHRPITTKLARKRSSKKSNLSKIIFRLLSQLLFLRCRKIPVHFIARQKNHISRKNKKKTIKNLLCWNNRARSHKE